MNAPTVATSSGYEAEVSRTEHGVAHVVADTWGSLGFGQGWACARDHLGTIADQITKVRGRRALHFGAGPGGAHVASDLGYRMLDVDARAEAFLSAQSPDSRALVEGYAAGVNLAIAQLGDEWELPAWCADAPWIGPITASDLCAHLVDVTLMASGRNLVGLIGRAEAPGPDGPVAPSPIEALGSSGAASNGWAFGRGATRTGRGSVMANPHFPWTGEARFWECHLTIADQLDVYGACLLGAPGVHIGFNRAVAWTHTFSRGFRFTLYRLDLVPGDPTRYRFGEEERSMTPTSVSCEVRTPDGGVDTVERTLWSTHHGPMVNLPLLGWGLDTGFAYRDANIDNTAFLEQFMGMDRAADLDEFKRAFATSMGMPWANTMAADTDGETWYIDASATPNLSVEAQQRFVHRTETDPVAALLAENRVAMLDGSDPDDTWIDEPGARSPGLVPHARLPRLEGTDFVANANDSHWLTHPASPLVGYSVLHGRERTARSLRTRANLLACLRLVETPTVDIEAMADEVLSNRSLTADLLLDAGVVRCRRAADDGHARAADLHRAADILERWDRTADLSAVGTALWRETLAPFAAADLLGAGSLFAEPFDPADALDTPRGLAERIGDADPFVDAVLAALAALDAAGLDPTEPLQVHQWAMRGAHRVAVHGGGERDGVLNILTPIGALPTTTIEPDGPDGEPVDGRTAVTGLRVGGYRVTYGASFTLLVDFTDDGPVAVSNLAYGQSGDPASVHHRDGTEAYAAKFLRPVRFTTADIAADPALQRRTITG